MNLADLKPVDRDFSVPGRKSIPALPPELFTPSTLGTAGSLLYNFMRITEYLRNGGKLEIAQAMANHESARTTGLYDRHGDQVSLDEIERIVI